MKYLRLLPIVLLCLLTLIGLAGCSTAGEKGAPSNGSVQQSGIWVIGEGKVTITPDIVNINLGVSSQESSIADAMAKTTGAMSKVITVLKSNNVEDKDIQTQQFNINPSYSYDPKTGNQSIAGYQVTNIVNVILRDTSKAASVISAVAEAGGDLTRINSVNFTVEDPTQYYKDARQKAIADADHKAQKLAGLNGLTLGKPTFVSENASNSPVYNYSSQGYAIPMAAPAIAINPGSTDITLYIQASYPVSK